MHYKYALVKPPGSSFSQGITSASLGAPHFSLAVEQHAAYCAALEQCGLSVIQLPSDDAYPDSTFVEDTAILTSHRAILTRPGAPSRLGEVQGIRTEITKHYQHISIIQAPGTLDGGDVCQAEDHFFIGISGRTNTSGAEQLASYLESDGYSASYVDLQDIPGLLHLKSGIAYLGDGRLVLVEGLQEMAGFEGFEVIHVDWEENYAANCVRVNDTILAAEGFPRFADQLARLGYQVQLVDVSEFQKMDGGLSCLSLRF